MSRDEMLKCYHQSGRYSLYEDSEASAGEYELAHAVSILNPEKEAQDASVARRQSEDTEYEDVSPDTDEDVHDISTDHPTTPIEQPFVPYIANSDYILASPATRHTQANSVYRIQNPNPNASSPPSKRHHDDKHPDPPRPYTNGDGFHFHATESEPAPSVFRRSAASRDDRTRVGPPDPSVPVMHGARPVVIAMFSKTPVQPRRPDETVISAPSTGSKPNVQRRETVNTGGIASVHGLAAFVHLKIPEDKKKHHDRRDVVAAEDDQVFGVNGVQRRERMKTSGSSATSMGPAPGVYMLKPTKEHDRRGGVDDVQRRDIPKLNGGVATFLMPAPSVHLLIPSNEHDRRDVVVAEDGWVSGVGDVQRRDPNSSSSDSNDSSDDGYDTVATDDASGDEATLLAPDSHVHKRPASDQEHKKDDHDKKKHTRSAAKRDAKKDEKKEKNDQRPSYRPEVFHSEPDFHDGKDKVYRRQFELVDPHPHAMQHIVDVAVFKRPGRRWVA